MQNRIIKRITIGLIFVAFLSSIFSIFSFATPSNNSSSGEFVGRSHDKTLEQLESLTNSTKNESGSFTIPLSSASPQITFLIPGYGSDVSVWSNNYGNTNESELQLAYNEKSLVEKIRNYTGATVYLADITTDYSDEVLGKKEPEELEFKAEEQSFRLYEFPTLCTLSNCDKSCGKFHENLEEFDRKDKATLTELPVNLTGHIVILFDPAGTVGSNDRIYEQFNYVADKIVYDVKVLNGGVLPKVNLISHSRGGLTAVEYALNHSFLVDSLVAMGGPFNGSKLGESESIINMINMSQDRNNDKFTYGVEDILNESKSESYKQRWNEEYNTKYSHINFCAIAGEVTDNGIRDIVEHSFGLELLPGSVSFILEFVEWYLENQMGVDESDNLHSFWEGIVHDDIFINSESQLAKGYQGVVEFVRLFDSGDIDFTMPAQKNIMIPHNLEPGDSKIHEIVLSQITFGNVEECEGIAYHIRPDNAIVITGLAHETECSTIVIPEIIDGHFVREIAPYAFANRTDIQTVVMSDYVTKVSHHAFFNCTGLTSVTSEFGMNIEVIEEYAFAGCTSLATLDLPNCTREIGEYAFANTAFTSIRLGTLMEDFAPNAFSGSALQGFVVNEYNILFEAVDGVLFNENSTKLIAYPSGKTASSFTIPSTVTEISPYAFSNATHLANVHLGSITHVPDGAFLGCTNLENVTGASVLVVEGNSFSGTPFRDNDIVTLGEVLVRYGIDAATDTLDYYSIASCAFAGNKDLESVKFSNKLTSVGTWAFLGCSSLTDVYFLGNNMVSFDSAPFGISRDERTIYVAESLLDDYQTQAQYVRYIDEFDVFSTSIQYDSNGGSSIPATEFSYYSQLTQEKLPVPTRIGYAFVGWVYGEGDNQETLSVGDWWLSLDEEVTLTASWIPTVYSSEFDPCGGILSSSQIVHTENGVQLPVPTRNGYIFDGWYSEEDGAGMQFTEDDGILLLEWDQTQVPKLYAEWTPISYTITYVLNGGTNASANPTTYTIEDSITFAAPTRSGYRFAGWYTDSAFSIGATTIQTTQGNITLYAKWQFLYTVTFEHNYSTITVQAISGEIITVPNFSSTDAPVYIYVSGATRLAGGASYEVNGNIAFKSEERLLSECYQIINNKGVYCIYTYNQFRGIEDITKNSSNKFMLMRDIDVSVTYSIHISDFYGEFDGNGKTLRYVREVVFPLDSYGGNYALFKRNYGTIKNCTINGLMIDIQTASDTSASTMYYAAFVAGTNYGTITGITVQNCEIIVNRQCVSVGTIAGYNYNGTISYCNANNITFTGYGDMGGIAGTSADGSISNCTASSITMTLSIDTVNRSAGGIVAYAYNGAYIANCSVTSLTLSFGGYKNIADTAVQPVMGFVVAYLQDSTATNISATGCSRSFGNLPEKTGTLFNRHFPRKYVCASNDGMIGYKNNSTVS